MIPARALYLSLAGWLLLALASAFHPALLAVWAAAGGLLALTAAVDALRIRARRVPALHRDLLGSLPVGTWSDVALKLHNPDRRPLRLRLYDHHPHQAQVRGLPVELTLPPAGWAAVRYRLRPTARGLQGFEPAQLRLRSPWRLWWRDCRSGDAQSVHVYPNYTAVMKYALLATDNRLSQMGIRRRQRRGAGLEFHQLREYRDGDSLRQIDWKASSRLRRLIARDYQDERDQQVIFLLDCGRRMRAADGALSHFDHSLNSLLLLAHVALRQGDAVGLLSFSGERRFLKPAKGHATVNRILNAVFDLEPGLQPPDYHAAVEELLQRQRRRSLVVLMTNLRDEDAGELLAAAAALRRRHLVVLASLRETALDEALEQPIAELDGALEKAATYDYLAARRAAHEQIAGHGVHVLDVTPEQLPVNLVNRYLDIKAQGAL